MVDTHTMEGNSNSHMVSTISQGVFDCHPNEFEALEIYRNGVPYATESIKDMLKKLDGILAKIVVCTKAKCWPILNEWTSALKW
jgi:hypothetical protein